MFRVQSRMEQAKPEELEQLGPTIDRVYDFRERLAMHALLRAQGSPFPDSIVTTGPTDPRFDFLQVSENFLLRAQAASSEARSYRNFNVGAMLFAELIPGMYKTFHGANMKLNPHAPKICAERVALEKATSEGYSRIVGVAVFGPRNQDHGSGLELPVLHPCEACRKMFKESPLADDGMLIASANPDGEYELTTFDIIWALHEEGVAAEEIIGTYRGPQDIARALAQFSIAGWIPEHKEE